MIDAGVEEDVVLHDLVELGPAVVERDPAEAAPVERHRAAAVRMTSLSVGKSLNTSDRMSA